MSQITTHVLDTSLGKPAEGIWISLERSVNKNRWEEIASGMTNGDGRIDNFMSQDQEVPSGIYRMRFDTRSYFERLNIKGFYPEVPVVFELSNKGHYHIPLLLSPFGYSTYRGS
jgi:5-hydroxyisourate hydrolase